MAKQKNTTLLLLIVLLALMAGAYFFLGQKEKQKTTVSGSDMKFGQKVEDVYKIFIADRDGHKSTLVRKNGYWEYNEKYKANPNIMKNLLRTIGGLKIFQIPTSAAKPHIIKSLATIGIKVELYDKNDDLLKAYYVGGMNNDETGTYMIMEGSDNPYLTYLPSLTGGLRGRYNIHGDLWRDKAIFDESVQNIRAISIDYPRHKSQSFVLSKEGKSFQIKPFYPTTQAIDTELKEATVQSFLVNFENMYAEGFENDYEMKDSVLNLLPFSTIEMETNAGDKKKVRFFPIDVDPSEADAEIERYFVDVDGKDFMMSQHRLVGKLFWRYESFFN